MRRQNLSPSQKREVIGWKVKPRHWWPELLGNQKPPVVEGTQNSPLMAPGRGPGASPGPRKRAGGSPRLAILIGTLVTICGQVFAGIGDSPEEVAKQLAGVHPIITQYGGLPSLIVPIEGGEHGIITFNKEKTRTIIYVWPATDMSADTILGLQKTYGGEWKLGTVTKDYTFWSNGTIIFCLISRDDEKFLVITGKEGSEFLLKAGKEADQIYL